VSFGWNGVVRGGLAFGDRVRGDARSLCDSLRARGVLNPIPAAAAIVLSSVSVI